MRRSPTPRARRPPSDADTGEWIAAGVFTAGGQAALEAYDKVVGLGQLGPVRRRLHRQGALRGPGRRPLACGPG